MARLVLLLSGVSALLAGCSASRPTTPPSRPAHPGFDTWRYPGDALMATWKTASPYEWTGYYLPSPCHRDASWSGRRAALQQMGWGVAVIYVGQQVFEGEPDPDSTASTPVVCSRTLLTETQGRADGADAVARASAEGFGPGDVVFLDVERTSVIPPALAAYVDAWTAEVLRDGRYRPGLYVHRLNAEALREVAGRVYARAGRAGGPPLWVAGGAGFSLDRRPDDVGIPGVDVWQGALDVERTWGGTALTIDENVARQRSPSEAPSL